MSPRGRLIVLLGASVVLTPYGTFVCDAPRARQCETAPPGLLGLWSRTAWGRGAQIYVNTEAGALYVFREGKYGLEWVDALQSCPRIAPDIYRCGRPKPGSVVP